MAAPAVAKGIALLLGDDLLSWGLVFGTLALFILLLPLALPILGFGAILALFGGLSGSAQGGGPVLGGAPTVAAIAQVPADQLALMQQVAGSAPCALPWTILAAIAAVDSGFGRTADQFSSAGAYGYGQFQEGTWRSYGGDIASRATDAKEQSRPIGERMDSTNYRYALPTMAHYLCAEGAGEDLRKAIFTHYQADSYVAEVIQLAARYGGIGAAGGGLIDGWADRPPLNQYDRRNYRTDLSWIAWRDVDCSAAALDWLLGSYGRAFGSVDDAITAIGPGSGISTRLGLLDERGPALAQVLIKAGLKPRIPGQRPLASTTELEAWLDRGPLLMDGARWFGEGHWCVAIGYDKNGVYTRDSSGWTRAISRGHACTARLASAVG